MEPVLDGGEIEALRKKARGRTSAVRASAGASGASGASAVSPFDPRHSGAFSGLQLQGVEALHKVYAEKISEFLSALVRTDVQMTITSVEQCATPDFLERLADPNCVLSFATSLGSCALVQMDLNAVFVLLDLILGGSGKDAAVARALTEIEREILEPLVQVVARALGESWNSILKIDFSFDRHLVKSDVAALLASEHKSLVVGFQFRLQEIESRSVLVFPSVVSSALLRTLAPQEPHRLPPQRDRSRLQKRLLESPFVAELLLPASTVSIRQLSELRVNDVLPLRVAATELLPVHVAGQKMFLASAVRCNSRRGAQVQKVLSIVQEGGDNE